MKKITLIILTKKRDFIFKRFFYNLYNKLKKNLNINFLVIHSSNLNESIELKKYLKSFTRVTYVKQETRGFMNACFESIDYVNSKYCTFIYDDDDISLYITQIYKNLLNTNNFSMGYGIVTSLNNKNDNFKTMSKYIYSKDEILQAYYGLNKLGIKTLPVSPICTIFKKDFLYLWKKKILEFCKNNNFRRHFLLKKNIGPDLMIYLFNIIYEKKIIFFKPHCASFVEHPKSMSVILGSFQLKIGYWLAKISLLNNMNENVNKLKDKLYTFLVIDCLYIIFSNPIKIFSIKRYYITGLLKELFFIIKSNNKFLFIYMLRILLNKFYRTIKF
jgi:hypothetical protein